MKPRLLVATSVHQPDDPRIRERLIRTLAGDFDITYAAPDPGPSDRLGIEVTSLAGSRTRRRRGVRRTLLSSEFDVAVVHDPELLPAAIAAHRKGRRVVFDMHEDLPAQLLTRSTLPQVLRKPASAAARRYLRRAERMLPFTLAEPGYARLLARDHPVFPNYPRYETFPTPSADPDGPIVYLGDITEIRGALTLVEAMGVASAARRLVMVGRCSPALRRRIEEFALSIDVDVELTGWLPHRNALGVVGRSAVGVSPLHDVPNYRHSLPTKTLEYLAMGVPTVATDLPGTRDVIGDRPGVELVPPGDAAALAAGIERALDAHVGRAAAGSAQSVRDMYAWPETAVRGFYLSLLR